MFALRVTVSGPDLRFDLAAPDPRAEAALRFAFTTIGIVAERAEPPALWEGPHLVYGARSDLDAAVGPAFLPAGSRGPRVSIPRRPDDRLWPEALDGRLDATRLPDELPFDVVAAIAAFLADDVNADVGAVGQDPHGRLRFVESYPNRHGYGSVPIVNVYVDAIAGALAARGVTGVPRWPNGRRAAIGLSHDVDMPDRYAFLDSAARPWRLRRSPRTYLRTALRLARRRWRDPDPHDYWLFDDIMASEESRGFRSTFFFATVPFHASLGAAQDVAYDAGSRQFRRVFRQLDAAGFEIGLHASYRAHEAPGRLVSERTRLAALTGTPVGGVRHHYWQLGQSPERTLRSHEAAGFRYDCSIAFNDHIGYRRSVALPFRPFDRMLERALRLVELPTFCMDGAIFHTSKDVDAGVAAVDAAVSEIVRTGGFGSIDWHIQTSVPRSAEYRHWGIAYQEILALLAARDDVWVTNLAEIERWTSEREAAMRPHRPVP